MKYVALQSFVDPSDGGEIVAGRTFVSSHADVYKRFPERFELARSAIKEGAITRLGGTVALVHRPRRRPLERSARSSSPSRPSWMLDEPEPESWTLR